MIKLAEKMTGLELVKAYKESAFVVTIKGGVISSPRTSRRFVSDQSLAFCDSNVEVDAVVDIQSRCADALEAVAKTFDDELRALAEKSK